MGDESSLKFSILLELSALNDLSSFKAAIEDEGLEIDQPSLWYGRRIGSRKMGFEERTPLMIAALFGSKDIADYIISSGRVDVNRSCGSDGATALHCAVAGFSRNAAEIVRLLLNASADANCLDANGNRPFDVISPYCSSVFISRKKMVEGLLKGGYDLSELEGQEQREVLTSRVSDKKEYPVDPTLPDIKNGIYGTDEFRMYTFKIKPCSRAYSHDWTECPFVHPGENARRRDPRKYHYSCVPCPEFRKGSCSKGDSCEYAHGIFECWLHPAQYRTRLCKDETNCSRRVCFFAHKPEELRPLYASTGSGVPSPRSPFSVCNSSSSSFDIGSISPLALGSPPVIVPPSSTPPLTPNTVSSPVGGNIWMNQANIVPPTLQLPGSRLKSALSARDIEFSDDIPSLSSPTGWNSSMSSASPFSSCSGDLSGNLNRLAGGMKPTNLNDVFGSDDPSVLQIRRSLNQQLRTSYPTSNSLSSSPVRANFSFGIDSPPILSSRAAAFAKRSQSFIERSSLSHHSSGISSPTAMASTYLKDWGSPDGKLDWRVQGDELHKLRKSASFGFRNGGIRLPSELDEPDVSWVGPLVKDSSETKLGQYGFEHTEYHLNTGGSEAFPAWIEQTYTEPEQTVA